MPVFDSEFIKKKGFRHSQSFHFAMLHIIELQESMEVMSRRASARVGLGQLASNGESPNLVLQPVVMLIITFLAKE